MSDAWRLIQVSVPSAPATQAFVERLSRELGEWNVLVAHARRAVADARRRKLALVQVEEMDELTILCPAWRAEAVRALAADMLRLDRPGGGLLTERPVDRAVGVRLGG